MAEFYLKEDLVESTILNTDTTINIESTELKQRFLDEVNEWYTEEAGELGVPEDDIMVYDPTIDIEDERNKKMVKLCEAYYLKTVFFALWKKDGDIYEKKLAKAETNFDKLLGSMTADRILGISPASNRTPNGFMTIKKRRGEY